MYSFVITFSREGVEGSGGVVSSRSICLRRSIDEVTASVFGNPNNRP